jgi:flagellar FliJ protein
MSADPLQSLNTLLEHAEGERDAALGMLRQAQAAADRQQAQGEQLQDYRQQFRARWSEQFRQPTTVAMLQCHQGFAQRLDGAISQQQQQAEQALQRVARARAQLQQREQRVAAVRKLIERRLQALQQQQIRRDQRQTDEAAQRAAATRAWAVDHS